MSINTWGKLKVYTALGIIIALGYIYYAYRINFEFIDSMGDNYTYELLAQSVFTSDPFVINAKFDYYDEHPILHQQRSFPPLHPIALAVGHLLLGPGMYANFLLTSLIGVLCAWPVFLLGQRFTDNTFALVAAGLTLISPTLLQMSVTGMSEPLFSLLSLFMVYYIVRWLEEKRTVFLVWGGLFTGLSYLCRANGLANFAAVFFFIILFGGDRESDFKARFRSLLLFAVVTFLTISPWLLRNYLVFGDPFYYVGRFSTSVMPGATPYGGLNNNYSSLISTLLANPIGAAGHYAEVFFIRIRMLFKETSVFLVLGSAGLFFGLRQLKVRNFLILYLFFNFAITMLTPYPYYKIRHLINIFPLMSLLSMIFISRFTVRAAGSKKKWCLNWSQALLILTVGGGVWLAYETHYRPLTIEQMSPAYQMVGEWLKQNSPAQAVIMTSKVSPIAYAANRAAIICPRGADVNEVNKIADEYGVGYFVSMYANTEVVPDNFEPFYRMIVPLSDGKRKAYVVIYKKI